jgi:ABC-type multidrug transport system ATPase subunit
VDDLNFTVRPGLVTGFLGPNGAGKSTTMRLILGLDRPTAGNVTVTGRTHRRAASPMREVGALLDARAVHGGRISPGVVEKHVASIFAKLGPAPSDSDNRRVIAAIRYLQGPR